MKRSHAFLLAISIMLISSIVSFVYSNLLYVQIAIVLSIILMILFAIIRGDKLKRHEIKKLKLSKIGELQEGLVKIKGRLHCDSSLKSKLTTTDCIGYTYKAMKWFYKKKFGESKRHKYKVFDSKIECLDFYVFDATGKIKIQSKDITILSDLNSHEIKKGHITYTENILLSNQQEYYLIGKIIKYQNKLVLSKSDEKGLIIASPNDYDIFLNTSKGYRIGCGIFLIILLIVFFLFMFGNLF